MGKICGNFQFCHPFSRWFEIKGFTGMQYLFDPPSFVQSFGHQYVCDISVHSLSHTLEQCCKAFVSSKLHFLNVSP